MFGWGCKPSDNVIPLNLKASFSPIQIGKFIIYSYEELNQNSFDSKTDTINYWIKETIETSFLDQEDIIFTHFEEEVYARGLGLIKRKFIDIETQPGKYKDGIEYTKTFIQSNW